MLRRTLTTRITLNTFGAAKLPDLVNEPCKTFRPGSEEAIKLREALNELSGNIKSNLPEVPIVINGERMKGAVQLKREIPSDKGTTLCTFNHASGEQILKAIEGAKAAHRQWSRMSFYDRAAIFQRACQLLSTKHRYNMMAATMLGQSKNIQQAEIDCIAELLDFWRFAIKFTAQMYSTEQPLSPGQSNWNTLEHRPLEGFVCSISPFNFTAIGGNLGSTPALLGNTILWKPSDASILSNYLVYEILEEAGLPPGVIQFIPCASKEIAEFAIPNPNMSCLAFTGSTKAFDSIYKNIGEHISGYRSYPRITGETGGKNFHLVHPSSHMRSVVSTTIRSAFEYQGQKCSACSRMFVPKSKWESVIKPDMVNETNNLTQGSPEDFKNFMCAVIHEMSFNKCKEYIELAKNDPSCKIVAGGECDSSRGWFVRPTIIETTDLNSRLIKEEIFGPILTVYVYDDSKPGYWEEICNVVDQGAEYGLTGAVYCLERNDLIKAVDLLRYTAGNFYINDKSTGSVVGNQPFGGSRRSGTNDKPGSLQFLKSFVSPRSIKECFEPMRAINYPHQE